MMGICPPAAKGAEHVAFVPLKESCAACLFGGFAREIVSFSNGEITLAGARAEVIRLWRR